MNQKQIRAAVEAMLFASGDPIGADKLAQAVQLPQLSVEAALEALRERYAREDSGLCLLHLNTRWQLATKTAGAACIRRLHRKTRSRPGALARSRQSLPHGGPSASGKRQRRRPAKRPPLPPRQTSPPSRAKRQKSRWRSSAPCSKVRAL